MTSNVCTVHINLQLPIRDDERRRGRYFAPPLFRRRILHPAHFVRVFLQPRGHLLARHLVRHRSQIEAIAPRHLQNVPLLRVSARKWPKSLLKHTSFTLQCDSVSASS